MLLHSCLEYERRNSRYSTDNNFRSAKQEVEGFLASAMPTRQINCRNMPWFVEVLQNYEAHNRGTIGNSLFQHLRRQINFAQNC